MIKFERTKVWNIAGAIYAARNAHNSWDKSDSDLENDFLGPNDLELAKKLAKAGSDHRKFMRQIFVSVDITAPLYWWKEFDTYKVGTVANSCSTMHKITEREFTLDDFSHEHLITNGIRILNAIIDVLNDARDSYVNFENQWAKNLLDAEITCQKDVWWQMIQLLPSSYNQMRTITLNYEVLRNIYHARKNHKLDEWHTFCDWIEALPYSEIITGE